MNKFFYIVAATLTVSSSLRTTLEVASPIPLHITIPRSHSCPPQVPASVTLRVHPTTAEEFFNVGVFLCSSDIGFEVSCQAALAAFQSAEQLGRIEAKSYIAMIHNVLQRFSTQK